MRYETLPVWKDGVMQFFIVTDIVTQNEWFKVEAVD